MTQRVYIAESDQVAIEVARRLRENSCEHGLPDEVVSATPIQPWGDGAVCKPLCDACVIKSVRDFLREMS